MKRIGYIILPVLMLVLLLGACASSEECLAAYAAADAQKLLDAGVFDGEMEPVDAFIVSMLYGIDEKDITECACYLAIDTSVSADELTVLVLTDEAAAQAAEAACWERVESQIDSCAAYCPDQVPRLEDAVILRRGCTVLLAVGNPNKLPQALTELGLN